MYGAYHAVVPVTQPQNSPDWVAMDVVGPICESGDTFAVARSLPPLAPGDLVAFGSAGAYGSVMSSAYNSRPPAPEVLVRGDRHAVVRARQNDRGPDPAGDGAGLAGGPPEGERMGASDEGWKRPAGDAEGEPGYGLPIALSWLALVWERLWPRFWTAAAVVFLFSGVRPARCVAPAARLAACCRAGRLRPRFLRRPWPAVFAAWRLPGALAARRRLERTSGLAHRPLTTSRDRLAVGSGDAFSEALWRRHRERARAALRHLRIGPPRRGSPGATRSPCAALPSSCWRSA